MNSDSCLFDYTVTVLEPHVFFSKVDIWLGKEPECQLAVSLFIQVSDQDNLC